MLFGRVPGTPSGIRTRPACNSPHLGSPKGLCPGRVPDVTSCVSTVEIMEPVLSRTQAAQALVEFGLLLALVAVVSIGSLLLFGSTVGDLISTLSHTVSVNMNP